MLGASGQIGWELHRSLIGLGDVHVVDRALIDERNWHRLADTYGSWRPDVVVNAAAYTAVDMAETETALAKQVNVQLPTLLADLAVRHGSLLIDYSTDYVFDGAKPAPYVENDQTGPLNYYGLTKLEGLRAIESSGCRHLVFRVSWVYSSRRSNFMRTILRLARERESLKIVDDQWGAPSASRWIAEMTSFALGQLLKGLGSEGIYHLTPSGKASWHQFATQIVRQAIDMGIELKLDPDNIAPIPTTDYPTPASRPQNSTLDQTKFESTFGIQVPAWETCLPTVIEELREQ